MDGNVAPMPADWHFDPACATLQVHTDVDGAAGRFGHRLTIVIRTWQATVTFADDETPTAMSLTAQLDSLHVEHGTGGVTPLTPPERAVARSNALKTLGVRRFPTVNYQSDTISPTATGYRLAGVLSLHGRSHDQVVDVDVAQRDEVWSLTSTSEVSQRDFGIKPFSMMMGAMRVADVVTVTFEASAART